MSTWVGLLRGINVGGRNKLAMKDLAGIFAAAGCAEVRTYIQSGNVVFTARRSLAARLPAIITTSIAERFGYDIPVLLRSAKRLNAIVGANPYVREDAEEKALHVAFLAAAADAAACGALEPFRAAREAFTVSGREIYLYLPDGVARTKLSNANLDRALGTISTMRNWRTTKKLLELTRG